MFESLRQSVDETVSVIEIVGARILAAIDHAITDLHFGPRLRINDEQAPRPDQDEVHVCPPGVRPEPVLENVPSQFGKGTEGRRKSRF
ncbi:hypothetical protein GCM10009710_11870 [Aeromicrobium alkaliterrae]|uniref:Uncharacterized protein n=1 Tax=Aeromicrobium alkaliterrae TaxID=302168 RepID=A0ABN2JMV7_9ACTN